MNYFSINFCLISYPFSIIPYCWDVYSRDDFLIGTLLLGFLISTVSWHFYFVLCRARVRISAFGKTILNQGFITSKDVWGSPPVQNTNFRTLCVCESEKNIWQCIKTAESVWPLGMYVLIRRLNGFYSNRSTRSTILCSCDFRSWCDLPC